MSQVGQIRGSHMAARQLGRRLKGARESAGLTLKAASAASGISGPTIERSEKGQRQTDPGEVWKLQRAYGFSNDDMDRYVALADATSADAGWFDGQGDLPAGFSLYAELEQAAQRIEAYEHFLVPGLLQTPDYAHAVIASVQGISREEIDKRLQFRLRRQERVLQNPEPHVRVVLTQLSPR